MNCAWDKTPNSTILRSIALTSNNMLSSKMWYSSTEREILRILHKIEMLHHYCFAWEDKCNHWPQIPSYNIQERFVIPVTMTPMHPAQGTPMWSMHIIQARFDLYMYDWIAEQNHTENKRWRNKRHETWHQCSHKHNLMHVNLWCTRNFTKRHSFSEAKGIHNWRLAIKLQWHMARSETILDI